MDDIKLIFLMGLAAVTALSLLIVILAYIRSRVEVCREEA